MDYIKRKYIRTSTQKVTYSDIDFEYLVSNTKVVSFILGEPASGKTFQLNYYDKTSKEKTKFIELINLDTYLEEENQVGTIFLLDSIDEAEKSISYRLLSKKIEKFIEKNTKCKFIISCRYMEWKKYFEDQLKPFDENIKVYDILPLERDDIDSLLLEKRINKKEFWDFVELNYLENLLKNILITNILIDKFHTLDKRNSYTDLYKYLVIGKITISNNEEYSYYNELNEEIDIPIEDILIIISSLASYMTLNHLVYIKKDDISNLSYEIYKVSNVKISASILKSLLAKPLFLGDSNGNIKFYHKSVQEYLTAYFFNHKNLKPRILKQIFLNKNIFLEEYEEVFIYLSNLNLKYFNFFIDIDPFIFRRHPNLNLEQQKNLLYSVLDTLSNSEYKMWGNWELFENGSLVSFDEKFDLNFIIDHFKNEKIVNDSIFLYLMHIFSNNRYYKKLEDLIFLFLENSENKKARIDNFKAVLHENTLKRVLDYIIEKKIINTDSYSINMHLIKMLYGKVSFGQLKNVYTDETIYDNSHLKGKSSILTQLTFTELFYLFVYLAESESNNHCRDEVVMLIIYNILLDYDSSNSVPTGFLLKLCKVYKNSNLHFSYYNQSKNETFEKIRLSDTKNLNKDFWELYFSFSYEDDFLTLNALYIIIESVCNIELNFEIDSLLEKYNFDKFSKNYMYLPFNHNDEIHKKFLQYKSYKELLDEREKNAKRYYTDDSEYQIKQKKTEEEYKDKINNYQDNILNIIYYNNHKKDDFLAANLNIKKDLGDKYNDFISILESRFLDNNIYIDLIRKQRGKTIGSIRYYHSLMFSYLFKVYFSENRLNTIINTNKEYKKFLYYWINWNTFNMDKMFIDISINYQSIVFNKIYLDIKKGINKSSSYTHMLSNFPYLIRSFEHKLEMISYLKFISKLRNLYKDNYKSIEEKTKINILKILAIDDNSYNFICEYFFKSSMNLEKNIYFDVLIETDLEKTIKLFYEIGVDNKANYIHMMDWISHSTGFGNRFKHENSLSSELIYKVISSYYKYFNEPKRNDKTLMFSDDEVYYTINSLFDSLSSLKAEIILKKLTFSNNNELKEKASYYLEKLYKLNLTGKKLLKDDYKNLLDSNYELISNNEELVELLVDVISEINKKINNKFNLKSLLYKDKFKHNEKIIQNYNLNINDEIINNYSDNPRTEESLQKLFGFLIDEELKKKKFITDREIDIQGKFPDIKVSFLEFSVLIELKRSNNNPIKYVKEQLIDNYLKSSDVDNIIYLIGIYKGYDKDELIKTIQNEIDKYDSYKNKIILCTIDLN